MKKDLSFIIICYLLFLCKCTAEVDIEEFDRWKIRFGKFYSTKEAEEKALQTWWKNRALIETINETPGGRWRAELNHFGDLTTKEFREKVLMPRHYLARPPPANDSQKQRSKSLPSAFDWRVDGNRTVVTSVKDQGTVGTCWAFSAVGNIEGQWALAGNDLIDLSPEYLVDCDGTTDGEHGDCSVFGGWPYLAYQFVIETKGIPSEVDWPYCSGTGDCFPCMQGPVSVCGPPPYYCDKTIQGKCPPSNHPVAAAISNYTTISTNEAEIAEELVQRGPLSVLLDATQLQFYKSGVWDGHLLGLNPRLGCQDGAKANLDHAVLLVGYGVEGEQEEEYWIVKNSWGMKWGEEGYFRMTRGKERCGINVAVTSSVV